MTINNLKPDTATTNNALFSQEASDALSKTKAYSVLGDWQRVGCITAQALAKPDLTSAERDLLLIYAAMAVLQQGETEQCRYMLSKVENVSAYKQLLARLLVSGVYETFGRIRHVMSDTSAEVDYFILSAQALTNDGVDSAARLRHMNACLDFNDSEAFLQAAGAELQASLRLDNSVHDARLKTLASRQRMLASLLHKNIASAPAETLHNKRHRPNAPDLLQAIASGQKPTVLIAGMRHCGSTALFNLLRLALNKLGYSVFSGYSEKISPEQLDNHQHDCALIKTHELRDDIVEKAQLIICPVRDIRDTVASAKRREFPMLLRLGAVEYAKHNRLLCQSWEPIQHYRFHYESFIQTPEQEVARLYTFLGISPELAPDIVQQVAELPTDKYNETLLSPTHITDKKRELTYFDSLTAEEISQVTAHNRLWLKQYGYNV